jgi:hypothetical protein
MAKAVVAKRQDNEARKAEFERVMHYATEWAWADGVEQEAMAALFVVLNGELAADAPAGVVAGNARKA